MDQCGRQNFVVHLLFFSVVLIVQSDGRYLRPSDHGLTYHDGSSQYTAGEAPEMLSFFNGGRTTSFPEAENVTGSGGAGEAWWKNREKKMSRDSRKSHVREILLLTSLICGLCGFVLLVASAFVCLIRFRRRRQEQQQQLQRPPVLGTGVEWSKRESLSTREATSALPSAKE